jgi:serine/threonine protein phosphatase 1
MLRFRRRPKLEPEPVAAPRTEAGRRVYAFGDLHGRADLFVRLRSAIAEDLERSPVDAPIVVGLGDYIDRGPDSRGVVEAPTGGFASAELVALRGNHEQMLLWFLEDPARHGAAWLRWGGDATLRSYGIDPRLYAGALRDYRAIRDELARQMPLRHLLFVQRLATSFEAGDYFFAHAGVRPGVALDRQADDDLLWIREAFTTTNISFPKCIAHGHTITEKPHFGRFTINVDTGAYSTNQLTCVVLDGEAQRLLSV